MLKDPMDEFNLFSYKNSYETPQTALYIKYPSGDSAKLEQKILLFA